MEKIKEAVRRINQYIWHNLHGHRNYVAIVMFAGAVVLLALLREPPYRLLARIASSALACSLADVLRLFMFPYVDLSEMIKTNPMGAVVFMVGWYGAFMVAFNLVL